MSLGVHTTRRTSTGTEPDYQALARRLDLQIWQLEQSGANRRILRAAREGLRGRLPERYVTDLWHIPFESRLESALTPGVRVLDIGAGARPMVAAEKRPPGTHYAGFDLEADELLKAPAGSYDEIVVGDVCELNDSLVGQFDVVLSWLTMEHVEDVPAALANLARYLRPGGRFLGYLSGAFSVHALLNRLVPHSVAKAGMRRLLGRVPDTVFHAHYDHCWQSALEEVASDIWAQAEIIPIFTGGLYFRFSRPIQAAFLAYEEWAFSRGHDNLAAYYLIDALTAGEPD